MASAEEPVLHVIVVGFHHKKGCQVEYSYPPLIEGNSVESHEIPTEWKNIPSLALPDGAHNYVKDTVYFLLPGRQGKLETVYGVSCYRQMDAKDLINKTADVTRSTVQKSVCVLSRLPLFGLIKAKLELITHAYFDERDFSQVTLLEQTYNNLNSCLNNSLLEGTQVFLDLPVRHLVTVYKHKILILFKLMLLERRVLVFGSPVESLCQTILGVASLFPGMLENGLSQACNQWNKTVSPTLTLANLDETQDEADQFLEVRYHSSAEFDPNSEKEENSQKCRDLEEAPVSPTIPRDSSLSQSVLSNENNNSKSSNHKCHNKSGDKPSNCDNKTSSGLKDEEKDKKVKSPDSPDIDLSQSGRLHARRSLSNDSDKLSVHIPHRSKKDSVSEPEKKTDEPHTPEDSPLAHISEITQIEAVQSGIASVDAMSNQLENTAVRSSKNLTLSSTKALKKETRDSISELDSPESLLEIDNEDCFSWEQDRLQLSIQEETSGDSPSLKESCSSEAEIDSKLSSSVYESKDSLDIEGSGRESVSSDSFSLSQTDSSERKKSKKKKGSKSPATKGNTGKLLKNKLTSAFNKKSKDKGCGDGTSHQIDGDVILQQDEFGLPLAIFTSGSVLYPYLSLQYHDILTDVSTRSFFIGATNILFKQRRQLIDVLVEIEDGKIDIRDKELQRQLHLTTADLRFAEYVVKTVTEDKQGTFMDGTEWEGSEEWIRAQFKFYMNSLLATVLQDDPKLTEDFGTSFISTWKTTHNFRHWQRETHSQLTDIPVGHPFQGNVSMSDVRNRFNHAFQSTERGKKINAAVTQTGKYVVQTGKVVGGAITSAKSAVSSWFSSWRGNKSQDGEAVLSDGESVQSNNDQDKASDQ